MARKQEQHGMRHTPEYVAWLHCKDRCFNNKSQDFHDYGKRGITVCDRWRHSFINFFADMSYKPSSNHSLDRIDNDGNYEPSNCRWATKKEQARNRRLQKGNISGTAGVTWQKQCNKWIVLLNVNGIFRYFGLYSDLDEAIAARKAAELKYW